MHANCLVKTEKTLNLCMGDKNRKRVPIDGSMWCQKAQGPYEDFSKGSPKMSYTIQEQVWTEKYNNYWRGCVFQLTSHCRISGKVEKIE